MKSHTIPSHNKLLCKPRCFLQATPLSCGPRVRTAFAREASFGPSPVDRAGKFSSTAQREPSRDVCWMKTASPVTLPWAIYKPFWMELGEFTSPIAPSHQPILHLISHFLVRSPSFILFLLSDFPSAAFVTYSGETNALFIPPSGDRNTSFPVAWHWGGGGLQHKLGQMGA